MEGLNKEYMNGTSSVSEASLFCPDSNAKSAYDELLSLSQYLHNSNV